MEKELDTSPGKSPDGLKWTANRSRNGVTLQQIADTTKISIRFLRAIEAEDFAILPGGLFGRSYIRQYAEAAGCDADTLLDRYRAHVSGPEAEESDPTARRPVTKEQGRTSAPAHWLRAFGSIRS